MIRPAQPSDVALLQDLLIRSKASWGYDEAFMAAVRDDLTLPPDYLRTTEVAVCVEDDRIAGFYGLRVHGDEAELVDLFVAPEAMGHGIGRRLWLHASARARAHGCRRMVWEADPNAEPFYLRMGAQRTGAHASTMIPGRVLPLMAIELASDSSSARSSPTREEA